MPTYNFESTETQSQTQTFVEAAENTKRYEDIARSVAERVKNVTPENKELVLNKMDKFFEENKIEGEYLFQALQKFEGGNSILCAQMNADEIKYGFGLYLQEISKLPNTEQTQLLEQTAEVLKLAKLYGETEFQKKNPSLLPDDTLRNEIFQKSKDPNALLIQGNHDIPISSLSDYSEAYVEVLRNSPPNMADKATTLLALVSE